MSDVVYLDTSAVLRAVLERGPSPEVERQLSAARYLVTSRLALVEAARVLLRLRARGTPESVIADVARELDSVWARCTIWELTPRACSRRRGDSSRSSRSPSPPRDRRGYPLPPCVSLILAAATVPSAPPAASPPPSPQ